MLLPCEDNKAHDVRRKPIVDQPQKDKSKTNKSKNEVMKQNKFYLKPLLLISYWKYHSHCSKCKSSTREDKVGSALEKKSLIRVSYPLCIFRSGRWFCISHDGVIVVAKFHHYLVVVE